MAFDPKALVRIAQAPVAGGRQASTFFYATTDPAELVEGNDYIVDERLRKGDVIQAAMGYGAAAVSRHYVVAATALGKVVLGQILADVLASMPKYVATVPMTVAGLLSTYPANADRLGRYARVTDLWGSVDEIMRCCSDGNTFYWRPQRTDYAVRSTQKSGTMTLTPLLNAPEIALASALTGNMDLALKPDNAWPGCSFHVRAPTSLGLFSLRLTGLLGGVVQLLTGGSDRWAVYTADGWVS